MSNVHSGWRSSLVRAVLSGFVALSAAVGAAGVVTATPAVAAPGAGDSEGGTAELRAALESASRGYLEAQNALNRSKQRQAELTQQVADIGQQLGGMESATGKIASAAYRANGLSNVNALIGSDSPDMFLARMTVLNAMALRNDRKVHELLRARDQIAESRTALDGEVANQQRQLDEMARKKQEAERALASIGGGQPTSGPGGSSSATATPAPRNADGSWPSESCSVDDPTTSGCITPRMAHAMQQAKLAGFTHYAACYRPAEDGGEHPRGRACDFAASTSGFGGVASGADKTYGDNLAAYFIKNSSALAVLYVIWFRQIWMPSTGWRAYTSGGGDPSSDHTNHVHLSVN